MRRRTVLSLLAATPLLTWSAPLALARAGRVLAPVVVGSGASPRVREAAGELAATLARITSAPFAVESGDGARGIAVGLPQDFPALGQDPWPHPTASERENYVIDTRSGCVLLLGATELAVEHAVWGFLHHLGYRQFFPGERWEILPRQAELSVQLHEHASPSYRVRAIWYGYGPWDYAAKPFQRWKARNRMGGGIELRTGHAYGQIIAALKDEFDRHPEFYPLVGGKRQPSRGKICLGNAELRRLVAAYELEQFRAKPEVDSVSLEPSDGGGWCECSLCAGVGSISDRVVVLANEVADAVTRVFPGKLVGIYAYGDHSPPPAIQVHPNVVVSVATAFLRGGFTVDELMLGWAARGATLGVRDYYSVNTWDRDQPGQARGGNLAYLARTVPAFHARGARFLSAESSDNWGPNGLGYYVASRILWDVRESVDTAGIVDDFLERAFGAAKEPMREFYRQIDGGLQHPVPEEQVAAMFSALVSARKLAGPDAGVQARLSDLALYAHYCSLYQRYTSAQGPARQAAFEELIRHAYRMRTTMMVHTKALYRDLRKRDVAVDIPEGARWNVPEGRNPWKSSAPFTPAEIAAFVEEGANRRSARRPFERATFGGRLVPAAAALQLPASEAGNLGAGRGVQTFFVHVSHAPATIELKVTGGLIAHYRDRGNVRIAVGQIDDATAGAGAFVAEDHSTPPDGEEHIVRVAAPRAGLYRISVDGGKDLTRVKFPPELAFVVPAGETERMNPHWEHWTACFYVPRGTRSIALYGGEHGDVLDGHGRTVFSMRGRARDYHTITVPQGEDGKAWRLRDGPRDLRLLNVPPYFAPTPAQLLVPAEVVERDR